MWTVYKLPIIIWVSYTWTVQGESSKPDNLDLAEETQHAVCNISTKDIQTSANASVTRQLKGVCTSKQLDTRFRQLELKIINELKIIKGALHLEKYTNSSSFTEIPESTSNYETYSDDTQSEAQLKNYEVIDEIKPIFSSFKSTYFKNSDPIDRSHVSPIFVIDEPPTERSELKKENKIDTVDQPFSNSVTIDENIINENIIRKLNNTVQSTPYGPTIYYFWKIENFVKVMSKSEMYVRSPTLLVHGHELMIQLHPNQPKQNYVTIKLKTSSSLQKKHTFTILHRPGLRKNIGSRLLGNLNEPNQFVVPLKLIQSSGCLINGSITLTLKIFLEMK